MEKRNLKFIFHLKNNTKPIILSEYTDESIDFLENKFKEIFDKKKENNKYILKTKTDCLITKYSNISAILISSDKHLEIELEEKIQKPIPPPARLIKESENKTIQEKNEYQEKLRLQ